MAQTELRTLDETEDGGAPSHGALVFPELIWKHYCWQHALHPDQPAEPGFASRGRGVVVHGLGHR